MKVMRLSVKGVGIALGIVWGIAVFLVTLISWTTGGWKLLQILEMLYVGYSISLTGAFIGLFWGFIDGLFAGVIIALVYNLSVRHREN